MSKILYQSSFAGSLSSSVLAHFGTLTSSAMRAESLFQNEGWLRGFDGKNFILLEPGTLEERGVETPEQTLKAFADFVEKVKIKAFDVEIKNPLRLVDCWTDDPIGSGAMEIFDESSNLPPSQIGELKGLFHPFQEVIYPEHIFALLKPKHLQKILQESMRDPVFVRELAKRQKRSEALGVPFALAAAEEVVWTSLTLKLREWALKKGYDSFVYKNFSEGDGEDSYVTLHEKQAVASPQTHQFDKPRFLEQALPRIREFAGRVHATQDTANTKLYWCGLNPADFWIKDPNI